MAGPRPKGFKLLKAALATRKSATMLAFGFSSGLPFALLIGTLTAWLGEVGVKLATIGIFSWIGLAYSFKFLWSPVVDRFQIPGLERIGRRKSWIALCQVIISACLALLALTNPATSIGNFVLLAFAAALASASHDIAIDGWRIDQADEEAPIELLSALTQFGYRTASIVGGAIALVMAARMSWPNVYLVMAAIFLVLLVVTLTAPDTPRPERQKLYGALAEPGALRPGVRALLLAIVGISWLWAIVRLVTFAVSMLAPAAPGATPPSVADFTKTWGALIIIATVFVPLAVAAIANRLAKSPDRVLTAHDPAHGPGRTVMNHLYSALVDPLAELSGRMGWGVLAADRLHPDLRDLLQHLGQLRVPVLSRLHALHEGRGCLRLEDLRHHHDDAGHQPGRVSVRQDRPFPDDPAGCDPAAARQLPLRRPRRWRAMIDGFAHLLRLDALARAFGSDERMMRLLIAICYENITTGLALTAFVAYVSSIVSKKYGAIQYALLGSLLSLGRDAWAGRGRGSI